MLSKLAAAVIAVSLIAGPALAQGGSNTLSARQHTAHVVKHGKFVKQVGHIKHVRQVAHHRHHGKFVKQFKRPVRTNG
jgi:hypothetical protein